MSLSFNWLDIAGLALAIVGFFNLAGPLERFFEGVRDVGRDMRASAQKRLKSRWPPQKHLPALLWDSFCSTAGIITFFGLAYLLDGTVKAKWAEYLIWPWWITALAALGMFVLLMFNGVIGFYSGGWFSTIVGTALWKAFVLLGKAPAGIVGSIGLLVTVGSVLNAQLAPSA